MARSNSQIDVSIALDTSQLEAGQRRAIRQFNKLGSAGDVAKGGLGALSKGMKTVGVLGGAMAGAIGVASAKMINLGSDAEESANAFSVTFKEATDSLTGFVDEFSTKAGFTTAELQQLLSFTGGVVNGMGASAEASAEFSKQVAVLSGDIGSLRNIDPSDVLDRITKSLTGEREGLKQLGIVINQTELDQKALTMTNKNAVSELTAMDRATATLTLIQERSKDAIGDLDNTSDGFANTQRRLKAELRETATEMGDALMPSVNELLPVISDLAENVLPKMTEAFAKGVEKVREFMKEFGDDILAGLKRGFQAFKDIGTIVGEAISRIVEFIRNNKILAKLFGTLTEEGGGFLDKLNEIAEGIRDENEAEKKANDSRQKMIDRFTKAEEVIDETTDTVEDFTDAVDESTDSTEDLTEEIQFGAVEFQKYTGTLKKALGSLKTLTNLQNKGKAEEERLNEATAELEESNIAVAKAQRDVAIAQEEMTALQESGTEVTAKEELAILKLTQQIEELENAEEKTKETELELKIAREELTLAIEESTKQSDDYFASVRAVEKAEQDLQDAIEDQKQAREDQIKAKKDLAEATKITAQSLLEEALAVKELEKAFGSFEAGTFKRTMEEIALLTDRTVAEIERAFANAGLTADSFSVPTSDGGGGSDAIIEGAPTFEDTGSSEDGSVGAGTGGSGGGSQTLQPVKIFTTFSIDNERFETVTQDAIINLQKQGKRVIL
jgi:hypothetical protein